MAARFINIERQTTLLLPPDLRDWVAEDDLVHFVIEAVERLPLSTFAPTRTPITEEAEGKSRGWHWASRHHLHLPPPQPRSGGRRLRRCARGCRANCA